MLCSPCLGLLCRGSSESCRDGGDAVPGVNDSSLCHLCAAALLGAAEYPKGNAMCAPEFQPTL